MSPAKYCLNDVRHKKTDLKVFVVVIPKEGWARVAADTDFSELDSADFIDYILEKSVSYQKKDGHGHVRPSSFWYNNDNDLKV